MALSISQFQLWRLIGRARAPVRLEGDAATLRSILDLEVFQKTPASARRLIGERIRIERYDHAEALLTQGAANHGVLFAVVEGEVETHHRPLTSHREIEPAIRAHGPGELLGHFSMLTKHPVRASVVTKPGAVVARLDLSDRRTPAVAAAREALQRPLAEYAYGYARRSGLLEAELEVARMRIAAAIPLIATLAMMSLYTLTLSLGPSLQDLLPVNFIYTPILIALFSGIAFVSIMLSGLNWALFGLCFKRFWNDLFVAVAVSAALLGALFGIKAWAIENVEALKGLSLITPAQIEVKDPGVSQQSALLMALGLYALFAPFQELVARSSIQAPLQALLDYQDQPFPKAARVFIAILIANLVFAAAHAHISLEFAVAAAVPGFIWGLVFWWTNSLFAVSISHILIGAGGLFLFGIEEILTRLGVI